MKKIVVMFVALFLMNTYVMAQGFTLKSDDLVGQLTNKQVFSGFGCTGENISPALSWENAPNSTKSFAVTVYDPDAPTGSGWWHWVVFNLSEKVHALKGNAGNIDKKLAPKGSIQSITDFGKAGFGGACNTKRDKPHAYIFTVYALDVAKLDLNSNSPPAMVGYFLNQHSLAKASLISYYGR